jgi:very-short-patch-repair endonuclease
MDNYNWRTWSTNDDLWAKLKPLAREKRHEPTSAESKLWSYLRGRKFENQKFRRQHTIERFIVDFFCAERKLVIEVDGEIHQYTSVEDSIRQEFLQNLGFRVVRFTNDEVLNSIEGVLTTISAALASQRDKLTPLSEFGEG